MKTRIAYTAKCGVTEESTRMRGVMSNNAEVKK